MCFCVQKAKFFRNKLRFSQIGVCELEINSKKGENNKEGNQRFMHFVTIFFIKK